MKFRNIYFLLILFVSIYFDFSFCQEYWDEIQDAKNGQKMCPRFENIYEFLCKDLIVKNRFGLIEKDSLENHIYFSPTEVCPSGSFQGFLIELLQSRLNISEDSLKNITPEKIKLLISQLENDCRKESRSRECEDYDCVVYRQNKKDPQIHYTYYYNVENEIYVCLWAVDKSGKHSTIGLSYLFIFDENESYFRSHKSKEIWE